MIIVKDVDRGSHAWKQGLRPGDRILHIDGEDAVDFLDLLFVTDDKFNVDVQDKGRMTIKGDGTPGFEVEEFTVRRCANDCIFCFVSQLPRGLRKSLYIKDDDYRMSFLYGSYMTMTNLSEKDIRRIERLHLSPLYISVHAADESVRQGMMKCPGRINIREILRRFADSGISFHTQIVVVPGVNDGDVLKGTVGFLEGLFPALKSITIVPVGLTDFRKGLPPLRRLNRDEAEEILGMVSRRSEQEIKGLGEKLIYATDEMYLTAERRPPLETVDELHDNGVGMYGRLMEDFAYAVDNNELPEYNDVTVGMITSVDGSRMFDEIVDILRKKVKKLDICPVENGFFGPMVTVTGLLSGKDIMGKVAELSGKYDRILIPDVIFNMDGLTVDGITRESLEKQGQSVRIVSADVSGLLKGIR